jgi:predicted Zn-dependent protease
MYMQKIENSLKSSGRIETDAALNAYIGNIICKLASEYCPDIRFYIVRTPHFNASMAPNGFMEVWTGLLLRAQNEAQLAYVLGHEIGHYMRRHSVQQWRVVRNTTNALAFFQIAAGAAGVGYAGSIAQLAALAGIFSFSRDQEREADDIGFDLMADAGYDTREAAKIWQALIEEREAADDPGQFIFFATHPSTQERVLKLQSLSNGLVGAGRLGVTNQQEYLAAIGSFRGGWLQDELRKREFAASQVVFDHLFTGAKNSGELYFYQGELFRMRAGQGDSEKAIENYEKALSMDGAPSKTNRSLGLMYWKAGELQKARTCFEQYLEQEPDANDSLMIKAYLEELE